MPLRTHEGEILYPERRAAVTTERALHWLGQHAGQRFFLWVHYYDPHDPYDPPEPYKTDYASDPYSGEIAYTDEQLGRLLDFLDQAKIRERTLVIVMGDHGEGLNDHGESTHGIFLYEEAMLIPFILAGPRVPSGQVIQTQVRSIDLLPTVAEFLTLSPNPAAQGVSLWPLIEQGKPFTGKGSNYAYIETLYPKTSMNWSELRGMRTDRWKFVLAPRPELYDLEHDPGERENVIKRYPVEADHLQQKIWEVIGPPQNDLKLDYMPVDAQTRQELASLGYVNVGSGRELTLNGTGPDPKDRVGVLRELEEYKHLTRMKSIEGAAQALRRALVMDPANPMVRLYLGMTLEKLNNWKRAAEVYQGGVERGTATSEIFSRLGKVYLRLRELDGAIAAMEKASSLNPTDLDNLNNLGTAYLLLRRADKAERAFKAVLVQDDGYAPAYNGLGLVAVQRGNTDAARPSFEKALQLDSEQVEPLLHLGLLYQGLGNKDEALRYLSLFLEKAPSKEFGHLLPQVRQAIRELSRSN
jgi:tetratricopeptide (TPR) repeat protein